MNPYFNTISPQEGFHGNYSANYLSSGNPCLDFFFQVASNTPPETVISYLNQAWSQHALTTLKLICNLRRVHGTGECNNEAFYTAALWLHRHHPKTLAANVASFAEFGYIKDLPDLLYHLLKMDDASKVANIKKMSEDQKRKQSDALKSIEKQLSNVSMSGKRSQNLLKGVNRNSKIVKKKQPSVKKKCRKTHNENLRKKALHRFNSDLDFRHLFERISDLYADQLKSDLESLYSGQMNKISHAAKWCPWILRGAIDKRIFTKETSPEYAGIKASPYSFSGRLQLQVNIPLRKALELPEVYLAGKSGNEFPYNLPHEVIKSLDDKDGGTFAEQQWQRIVDDLYQKGNMKNCIAVCDVSGGMKGIPMEICVALGILISELSEEPWKGKVITFSHDPQLYNIEGKDLKSKVLLMKNLNWGMNVDLQKVFEKILEVAVNARLNPAQMIKRVFVFSHTDFNQASRNPDYMVIKRKYEEMGYGYAMPEIVFWNLRDSRSTLVPENQNGVALMRGYSKNFLTMFFNDERNLALNPVNIMLDAISGEVIKSLLFWTDGLKGVFGNTIFVVSLGLSKACCFGLMDLRACLVTLYFLLV